MPDQLRIEYYEILANEKYFGRLSNIIRYGDILFGMENSMEKGYISDKSNISIVWQIYCQYT